MSSWRHKLKLHALENMHLHIIAVMVVLALVLLMCSGCATAEAVEAMPTECWFGIEGLIVGVFTDLWSLVDLLL